ncbi:MAG: hypothetical protein HDR38_01815 [Treponema sp.]|nr:hypothetical protein [Treponema sp.]
MEAKNRYDYLLEYSKEEAVGLQKFADEITRLTEQNQMDEADKAQLSAVMKKIIQRGDTTSYCCVNLLKNMKTDEMRNFLLDELRKDIFINEPLSIEIMKLLPCKEFPEYHDFLKSVKDNPSISSHLRNFINVVLDSAQGKRTADKYDYLLKYPPEEAVDLSEAVYEITELIEQEQLDEVDKAQFSAVMKKIIQRGDVTSYACANLLRDIMTDEMYDFLLEELKKDVFRNVPLSIEIMKIIDVDDFPEYLAFLESIKDNPSIPCDFRNFITIILDFHHGIIGSFGFPTYKRSLGAPGVKDIKDIEFDWTGLADYEFYKSLALRKKIIRGIVRGVLGCGLTLAAIFFILLK